MSEQETLNAVCIKLGFEPVTIARIDRFRWTLNERDGLGPQMIKIEREVQAETKRPIDLRLEPKQDKNKRFDRNYLRGVEKL